MAKLIPVGISINGRRGRSTIMPGGRYLYSCPNCTGLVSNDQSYCEYRRPAVAWPPWSATAQSTTGKWAGRLERT